MIITGHIKFVVDRTILVEDIYHNGLLDIIDAARLKKFVLLATKFVKNVVLEFYTNFSNSMFDTSSPQLYRTFFESQYIKFYPAIIDKFVGRKVVVYHDDHIPLDLIAHERFGWCYEIMCSILCRYASLSSLCSDNMVFSVSMLCELLLNLF